MVQRVSDINWTMEMGQIWRGDKVTRVKIVVSTLKGQQLELY